MSSSRSRRTKSNSISAVVSSKDDTTSSNTPPPSSQTRTIESLQAILGAYGYKVLRGINIGTGERATLAFLKASYKGEVVYIDLDKDYVDLVPSKADLSVTEVISGDSAYLDSNIWAEKCTSIDCDTMFECVDGLCSIKRADDNMLVKKTSYVLTSKPQARVVTEDELSLTSGHPIVRISEIESNAAAVANIIARHSMRLRHQTMLKYDKLLIEFDEIVHHFSNESTKLSSVVGKARDSIEDAYVDAHNDVVDHVPVYPPTPDNAAAASLYVSRLEAINEERESLYKDAAYIDDVIQAVHDVVISLIEMRGDFKSKLSRYDAM